MLGDCDIEKSPFSVDKILNIILLCEEEREEGRRKNPPTTSRGK
jgi:hypothetical protein